MSPAASRPALPAGSATTALAAAVRLWFAVAGRLTLATLLMGAGIAGSWFGMFAPRLATL